MIGILNVFKPKGMSSSNVVVKIKKILNLSRVGHMGTLDPMASGVLLIGINKATRLFDCFLQKDKTYVADFKFGEETDTLDSEGQVIFKSKVFPTAEEIKKVLPSFIGEIEQIPPHYSSKKIEGKRAYNLARKGICFDLKPSKISIFEFKLESQIDSQTFRFLIRCSSGTYIRALARDLAKKLNTFATMSRLERIKSGEFNIENALDFEKLNYDSIKNNLIKLNEVLKDFNKINLTFPQYKWLLDGINLDYLGDENKDYALVFKNKIVGIGKIINKKLKITTFLADKDFV